MPQPHPYLWLKGRNLLLGRWSRTLLVSRVTFLHLAILEQEYSVLQSNLGSEHDSLASIRLIPPGHSAVPLTRPLPLCLRTRLLVPVNQPKKSCKLFTGEGWRVVICKVLKFGETIQGMLQFLKVNIPLILQP